MLEAWKAFRMKRAWLAADLCQPVYELFLAEAISRGRMRAPGFFLDPVVRAAYCKAQWNGPAQGMIDPSKEADAAEKRISIGVSTRQREPIEMTGGDFDSNIAQLAREERMMREAGLSGGKKAKDREADGKEDEPEDGQDEKDSPDEPGEDDDDDPGDGKDRRTDRT